MARVAVVTGASSGLGAEYAKLFAADRHDVVLVARRRDRLEALAATLRKEHGVQAHVVAADLGEAAGPSRVVDAVKRLEIDFLVNNAGFATHGEFRLLDPDREMEEVQVNVNSLVALTRAFLPAMVARGRGRILNVGSTAGFVPGPYMATYYATKAFVNSFTEALAFELRGTGVSATVSCPGATATEFSAVAGTDRSLLFRLGAASAAQVAREGYRAMMAGRPLVVHGARNKLSIQSLRVSPRAWLRSITASLNRVRKEPRLDA